MTRAFAVDGQGLEAEAGPLVSQAHLRECPGCGLFQVVPALPSRSSRRAACAATRAAPDPATIRWDGRWR